MSIGIGILGFAHSHVNAYCARWRQMPDANLVGGWDHDSQRTASAKKDHGIPMFEQPEQLLARPDIDAVVVTAETSLHTELVEKAAAARKMIVLQKPMALTLKDADRMVQAVKKAGVRFSMAWQMRVDPQNLRMKQLIQENVLGRIFMVRRRHGLSTQTFPNFDQSWFVKPELNRGMWADDAAHPIDFLSWLLGEPATVMAEIGTLLNPKIPDDNGIAVFRYANGTMAETACSFTCLAGENTTEIVGEKGVIIQNYGDGPSCNVPRAEGATGLKWYLRETGQWTHSDIPSPDSHSRRIEALAAPILDFFLGRREAIATAEEGRASLRMTLACYRSAETGRRVSISEIC